MLNESKIPTDTEDQADYRAFLAESGITEAQVRTVVDDRSDHADMPEGFDAAVVAPSPIEGCGMFATRTIQPGEHIGPARAGQCRTVLGRMTNHAKHPNCTFIAGPGLALEMFATRRIDQWQELTIDYRQAARVNPAAVQALQQQAHRFTRERDTDRLASDWSTDLGDFLPLQDRPAPALQTKSGTRGQHLARTPDLQGVAP